MFGLSIKPENIMEILPKVGIDPAALLPKIEEALVQEAAKISEETGRRVFLIASVVNHGKNIQVGIYTEGNTEGDVYPYRAIPFGEILNLFKSFEKQAKNEISYQRATGDGHSASSGNESDPGTGAATLGQGAGAGDAEPQDKSGGVSQ